MVRDKGQHAKGQNKQLRLKEDYYYYYYYYYYGCTALCWALAAFSVS
jgi:hypothetical protein